MDLERVVAGLVEKMDQRYYGKYRGLVADNQDPDMLGRLKLRVPGVLGSDVVTGWAMPCVPFGGAADQGFLFIPDPGAGVWVEFEGGDLEFPIWTGMFWSRPGGDSQLPRPNDAAGQENGIQNPPTSKIIKTKSGHTLQFEDAEGGESILIYDGIHHHIISLNEEGIKITDGQNGNDIIMDSDGITIQDDHQNKIILSEGGIRVGSEAAHEAFVLGDTFLNLVAAFNTLLTAHTHLGNLGGPTSPPIVPLQLSVPLSPKHRVE